jgi:hypothetical protein
MEALLSAVIMYSSPHQGHNTCILVHAGTLECQGSSLSSPRYFAHIASLSEPSEVHAEATANALRDDMDV